MPISKYEIRKDGLTEKWGIRKWRLPDELIINSVKIKFVFTVCIEVWAVFFL